ncbi:hypothetical protein [Microbacterium sp.]|uniref:hypothetical protein n=1 Tax=Microbacterium sp. TaxID=51671 RepID=UPI003A8C2216
MQILLAVIFGAAYGALLHYLMPARELRGAALAPMAGAVAAGLTWLVMTWLGAVITDPWIWLASIAVPAAVVPVVLTVLTRTRTARDARQRVRLGI